MTTTPSDDYDTSGLVSGQDGFTGEDDGTTPGPGPRGEDLHEPADQTAKRAESLRDHQSRTPGTGPDGSDLGETEDEVAKVRKEHIAKHAATHGHTKGPGPGPREG